MQINRAYKMCLHANSLKLAMPILNYVLDKEKLPIKETFKKVEIF